MLLFAGLVLTVAFCISSGEVKLQTTAEEEQVSMECTFSTSSFNYNTFYWYRQYPGSVLQFILHRGTYTDTSDFAKERFDATADESSGKTILTIKKLIPEDTAFYYCALIRSGLLGYADKLTFGTGTRLTVLPKGDNREPVLSILQNQEHADRPVCLATGFFPKDGQMDLTSDDGQKRSIPLDKAPLSSDKTYFFVGLSKGSIKNCSLHGITEPKEVPQSTEEDTKSNTETPEIRCVPPPAENVTGISTKHNDYPKVNFMSLAVNGLRILFAKTVTFNMLMTLKAVVF